MNAKKDPLFDAHSIEEIKIYSDYNKCMEPPEEKNFRDFMNSPMEANLNQPIVWESPKIRLDVKFKAWEEGPSMDNTNQMLSSTLPSFSFKNKTAKSDNQSLMLFNSRKLDQNSKDKNENTFDSTMTKFRITNEHGDINHMNSSTPAQSRNFNIFDHKEMSSSYCKYLDSKHPLYGKKFNLEADAISEYSLKSPTGNSEGRSKITKSLTDYREILKPSTHVKYISKDLTKKVYHKSQKFSTGYLKNTIGVSKTNEKPKNVGFLQVSI